MKKYQVLFFFSSVVTLCNAQGGREGNSEGTPIGQQPLSTDYYRSNSGGNAQTPYSAYGRTNNANPYQRSAGGNFGSFPRPFPTFNIQYPGLPNSNLPSIVSSTNQQYPGLPSTNTNQIPGTNTETNVSPGTNIADNQFLGTSTSSNQFPTPSTNQFPQINTNTNQFPSVYNNRFPTMTPNTNPFSGTTNQFPTYTNSYINRYNGPRTNQFSGFPNFNQRIQTTTNYNNNQYPVDSQQTIYTSGYPMTSNNNLGYPGTLTNTDTQQFPYTSSSQRFNPSMIQGFPYNQAAGQRNSVTSMTNTQVNPYLTTQNTNTSPFFPSTTRNGQYPTQTFPLRPDTNTGTTSSEESAPVIKLDPVTGLQYSEDPSTGVWTFLDNNGIPYPVKFQEGVQNIKGFTSYIETDDGRQIFISGKGQPVNMPTNPVRRPIIPSEYSDPIPPAWPFEYNMPSTPQ